MKKKTAVIGGTTVLVLVGALIAADIAGWPGLAPRLAERAGLGLEMDPGARVHLLFNPRLASPRLRVLSAAGEPLADAGMLDLRWAWRDLWAWRQGAPLRLRLVQADTLTLTWERDAAGLTPWPIQPKQSGADAKAEPTPLPQIDHLVIRAGSARVDDVPLQLRADARFATEADGRWTAGMKGRLRGQELSLDAEASAGLALLSSPEAGNAPVKLRLTLVQGPQRLSFDGTAASLLDARALDGMLAVKGSSLAAVGSPFGVTLPSTPDFDLAGRLQHAAGVWQLGDVKARIGQSKLGGDFAFDRRGPRSMLSGMLRGGPLRLADLGPAVGTDTPPSRAGRLLPDRKFDLPALNAMDARVAVALSQLDLGTTKLEPLSPVNVSVVLESGVLTLDHLNAGVAGGVIAGSAQLDTRTDPPLFQTSLDARGLAVERWLKFDVKALTKSPLTGKLQAEVDLKGQGSSTAALLGSATGPLRVRVQDGSVSHLLTEAVGLDIAQGLGMLIKGDDNLPLNCATLDGRFTSGVLRPRSAIIDNRDSRIDLDGTVSLKDETLDLRAVARPKDFSPLTLRAPVRVQGTLADPRVALEGKRLGGRAIAALALGALATPAAALLAFVDPGENLPPVDCSLAPTGQPREAALNATRSRP
ncbi:AsmA family protein [Roseateles sp.]|uniref:AsmA family protein n=1 Tax=Roseateles sp. TaxID=1971397 RepID=UPI003BA866BF